ncbi:tetratricopeptide repeat protein [Cognatilysobacter segetis]|uniref:tetratricopeptide repeat protein n=1 Tax=Cognatilysobacter segetis TaxID=2492394 RepID=UPI00105E8979|nr:tetratricopeptide repeat protein [Lysobacter segetis]
MDISPRTTHAPLALAFALTAALAASGCQSSKSGSDDFFRVADAPGTAGAAGGSTPAVTERVVVEAPSPEAVEHDADVAQEDDVPRDDGPGRSAADAYMRRDAPAATVPAAPARSARTAPPVIDARAPRVATTRDTAKAPPREVTSEPARDTATQPRAPAAPATAIDGDARSLNARAIALINGGRPEAAIPLLEHALALQPRDAEMLGNLGYAYMLVGEHARARSRFVAALDLSPTRSATWLNLGQTYAELGRQDAALDAVLKGYR